jgi:hypothetical protein
MLKPTRERILELLDCDPLLGILRWKVWRPNGVKPGDLAGSAKGDGYLRVCIDGKRYGVHQVIWFYVHGTWPARIDHKDRNPERNSIQNLRIATRAQNIQNCKVYSTNSAGFKGVSPKNRRFVARVTINKKTVNLGAFDTPEEAHQAYCQAAKVAFGEFFSSGQSQP